MYQNDFQLAFPLQKINAEKRIVTGIATANNIDLGGDIIDFQASMDAFANWIGNIREMHDPKSAVGKMVDWRPTQVMYKGVMYDAIEVDVYISKGAESTWQKILDGTLKGFSIGGRALEKQSIYDEDAGGFVNLITKYMLGELSVVDNPCNPTGMFMLIKRADDGTLETVDQKENVAVFYCSTHKYATIDDNKICPSCSMEMEKIGYVQTFDADVVNKMISDFELDKKGEIMSLHKNKVDDTIGDTMNDLTEQQKSSILSKVGSFIFGESDVVTSNTPNVTVNIAKGLMVEDVKVEEDLEKSVSVTLEVSEDKAEDTDSVKEVEAEDKIEKSVDETAQIDSEKEEDMDLDEILKGVASLLDEKLATVKEEISAEVDAKVSTIEKSVSDFKEEATASIDKANEEIEKVANTGAIQKSVDIDEEDDAKIEKVAKTESFWGNIFVPEGFAEALGYES